VSPGRRWRRVWQRGMPPRPGGPSTTRSGWGVVRSVLLGTRGTDGPGSPSSFRASPRRCGRDRTARPGLVSMARVEADRPRGCQAKDAPSGYCAGPQRRRQAELVSETMRGPGEEDPLRSFNTSDARAGLAGFAGGDVDSSRQERLAGMTQQPQGGP
jgi:hypothetical protein